MLGLRRRSRSKLDAKGVIKHLKEITTDLHIGSVNYEK